MAGESGRPDWTSVYYHRADKEGIGFDRTLTGSDALSQYHQDFSDKYSNVNDCPQEYLLWFHHVSWNHTMPSGRTLWDELCYQYHEGVKGVEEIIKKWQLVKPYIDKERFEHVSMHLEIQRKEAKWWRDACLSYFQTFSGKDIPNELEQPEHGLEYYKSLSHPFAPGIRPRW